MASRFGYERQINPGGTPALPMVSPAPYEEIGAAIGDFGQGLTRAARIEADQRREAEQFAFARDRAEATAREAQLFEDAKGQAGPAGEGFTSAVLSEFDRTRAAILPADPRVRERAEAQNAEDRARLAQRADLYERGQRVAKLTGDVKATSAILANGIYLDPSTEKLGQTLDQFDEMVDPTSLLTPEQKVDLKREFAGTAFEQGFQGLLAQGRLSEAAGWLKSDLAAQTLDPGRLPVLGNALGVEVRRQQAAEQAAQNVGKAEANTRIQIALKQLGDGIAVPDTTLAALQQQAQAFGLDTKVYDVQVARVRAAINRETEAWTPADFEKRIAALTALGDKASASQQVELDQLRQIAPARTSEFKADPGQWAARAGSPRPPINPADPASFAARGAWARSVQAASGSWTPPLSAAEAAPLADAVSHGTPKEKLDAAQQIAAWGQYAPDVLRQVAGGDEAFKIAVRLSSIPATNVARAAMRDALLGPDARKAAPGIFDTKLTKAEGEREAGRIFTAELGAALSEQPVYARGLLETAKSIYASRMARRGGGEWNEGVFRGALQSALGGYLDDGQFVGGVVASKGENVVMPSGMAQAEFERRIARAMPKDWAAAAIPPRSLPVWADGRSLFTGDLRAATPVALGDGVYGFRTGNGWVMAKDGGRYRIDIRKLTPQ